MSYVRTEGRGEVDHIVGKYIGMVLGYANVDSKPRGICLEIRVGLAV